MKQILPLLLGILFLFFLRVSNLSIRLSDTNIYFYTAFEILQGKMLYKDIFFTNLPLFPYISSLYLFLSGNNIFFYYLTPTIEISCISLLIYFIVKKKYQETMLALCASFLYLFSFMILSTSEHQTGVFMASLFAVIAYYFKEEKKYIITGIFLSLMLLTKAYFIPVLGAFFITTLLEKNKKYFIQIIGGFLGMTGIILAPFLLFSQQELFRDVFSYSLTRSAGVSKIDILWFFIIKDLFFFILILFNVYLIKKNNFPGILCLLSISFFILYSDPYYLYLNFLPPFLCLSLPYFIISVRKHFQLQKMVYPTIMILFLFYTFSTYYGNFRNLGTYQQIDRLTSSIRQQPQPVTLYGVNDATPALAFLTKSSLLNNIVDTNTNIFRKKLLDATQLTNDAIQQKSLIVVHGAYYPEYGIDQKIVDEIVDEQLMKKRCKLIHSEPIFTEGITNRLNLFSCR